MSFHVNIADGIGEIVISHPPVNALDTAAWNAFPEIITETGSNQDVRCVMIRAEGKGFCAGVDIKEMQKYPERITELNRGNYLTYKAVRACEVPVVTAVHNYIIGGGVGISGASDVIIAADDAFFSLSEIDRGAMGGASHLSRMIPLHKVRALFFTGGSLSAQEAFRLGAIEKGVSKD
ncbi:MAG TPA: enoyl-CoA hydratase, partial [Rhodospirillaceae bacterium]|nr:enoyl-CoA hydratase [Rhodospirillaceae bacterium]